MTQVEWSLVDLSSKAPFAPGDLVSAEAGGLPVYSVVGVDGERVWLREEQTKRDHLLPTRQLRWRMHRVRSFAG